MRVLLDHLEELHVTSADDLADLGVRLQVERVLTQAVDLAVEINAHVASTVRGRPPGRHRMAESGWSSPHLARALKPSVGLC